VGEGMTSWQKLARWIANHLPLRVIYFAVVRARHEMTEDKWPDDRSGVELTVGGLLSRLHVKLRDGKIQDR